MRPATAAAEVRLGLGVPVFTTPAGSRSIRTVYWTHARVDRHASSGLRRMPSRSALLLGLSADAYARDWRVPGWGGRCLRLLHEVLGSA